MITDRALKSITMKESNHFNFSMDNITEVQLLSNPQLIVEELENLPFKEYLFDNLSTKDGAPTFSDLKTINLRFDSKEKKGKFRITFAIDRTYCCSDTQSSMTDYADFDFHFKDDIFSATTHYFVWELNN